jgi:hypothetical protein
VGSRRAQVFSVGAARLWPVATIPPLKLLADLEELGIFCNYGNINLGIKESERKLLLLP